MEKGEERVERNKVEPWRLEGAATQWLRAAPMWEHETATILPALTTCIVALVVISGLPCSVACPRPFSFIRDEATNCSASVLRSELGGKMTLPQRDGPASALMTCACPVHCRNVCMSTNHHN